MPAITLPLEHIVWQYIFAGHRVPAGIGGGGFYAATKHAVCAMSEGLRQEARAAGVPLRVSCLSPGVVHTDFFSAMSGGDSDTVKRYEQLPGLTAADVASSVLFVLSSPAHMEVNDILVRPTGQSV
jgi:17beta-estradiol 17-dehydrogenase / 3beta-hydroxysteroid 3-dehydrogenase